jgi:hypothetical protein
MSTALLSPGTIVDGKFTIGAPAWARAGAQSHAAVDERGRAVLLTAYAEACFSSGLVLERSLRELRQLQSLQSARVAAVLACGKLPTGGIYEVNALLPESRLDEIVAGGPMSGPEAAAVIEQVGEGLLEAQKAGVIHRNLGPRVVFVGPTGVVVAGFSVGEPHGAKSFGPLDTIAPEQVEGKVVDQRTLIYNLAALMHMLLRGAPLFGGDATSQLAAHLQVDPPDDAHARLRRALGKDPRMRPMMLKQFLAELRAIGGAAASAPLAPASGGAKAPPLPGSDLASSGSAAAKPAGAPSSRGWTMFMKEEGEAPPAAATPTPAASDVQAKPKTRGWTMFMEGADEGEPTSKAEDKPAPKPSTRGWTMFMEDEEGQAPPAVESPISMEAAPPVAAPAAEAAQPKTRGWTMFMEEEEGGSAQAAAPAPAPAPMPATAPTVGGAAPKPSTRGWTMFMKSEDEGATAEAIAMATPAPPTQAPAASPPVVTAPVAAPPVVAPPIVAPPVAAPPVAAPPVTAAAESTGAAPKSRGWTMFTEATAEVPVESAAAAPVPAVDEIEVEVAPVAEAPAPATTKARRGDADAPSKKRGWTMFMEKPISDAKQDALGGAAPSAGESNAKGWTVFSPTAEGGQAEAAADAASSAADRVSEHAAPPLAERPSERSGPRPTAPTPSPVRAPGPLSAASGQTTGTSDYADPQAAADSDRFRAKTLIVTGPPDAAVAARPKTMVTPPGSEPGAAAPVRVVTLLTPEQSAVPNPVPAMGGDPLGPPSGSLSGPISSGAISGPISTGFPVPTGSHAIVPAKKGSPVGLIIAVVVIVAAAIVGAVVMLT